MRAGDAIGRRAGAGAMIDEMPPHAGGLGGTDQRAAVNRGLTISIPTWPNRLLSCLSGRAAPWIAICAGVIFTAPSICTGYIQDDHFFRVIFQGESARWGVERGPLDSFVFSAGAGENPALKAAGILPWWTADDWHLKFSRPVASLSHYLDYRLFGDNPVPMHMHNLAVLAGVIGAAAAIFNRLMPGYGAAAGLAAVMYAVDACHGIPAGWISHRNSMYAELFGLLALLAHDRARRRNGWRKAANLGPAVVLFSLSLLSGEIGIAMTGYFVAHALFLDDKAKPPGAWRVKAVAARLAAAMWPYVAVVALWRALYDWGDYGADQSAFYVDPMGDPPLFFAHVVEYFPILFMALFTGPDSMLYMGWDSGMKQAHYGLGLVIAAAAAALLLPRIRHSVQGRFWITGSVLSVLPLCAAMPTDRLLVIPALGSMALLALFITGVVAGAPWLPRSRAGRAAFAFLVPVMVVIHLVISPFVLTMNAMSMALMGRMLDGVNASVPLDAFDAGKRVVVINTPLDIMGSSFPIFALAEYGRTTPGWTYLHAGVRGVDVTAIDEYTLEVRAPGGYFTRPWTMLFGNTWRAPLPLGTPIPAHGFTANVTERTPEADVTAVRFTFDHPLHSDAYVWLTYEDGRYVSSPPPPIGQRLTTAGVTRATLMRKAKALCAVCGDSDDGR